MITAQSIGIEPALPTSHEIYGGLTKRELFSAMAMQGILANPYYAEEMQSNRCSGDVASAAAYHANALLVELAKDQP